MNFDEYREKGKETVDYIADYLENIRSRRVFPDVTPGYIRQLLPAEAPDKGEKWEDIFKDVERVIMPGITHWQSPHMHAYFPALNSFPSLLGDMISDAINCIGFTWASSPAATELEALMMDWLVKCLGLPEKFLGSYYESLGGGVLQTSVSESTYYALLAARTKIFEKYGVGEIDKYAEKAELNGRLVCYCSDQAHSSVEKSALVALTRIEILPTDENHCLRGETLRDAIEQSKRDGLIPFFVCATLGTTGVCAFDNLDEIGPVCAQEDIWLHIDAAYAGTAFFCPEYRGFINGIEFANSFVFNPSKWMMVSFDCTCFWVDNSQWLHKTFTVAPLYLKHKYSGAAIDYMHWQVGLSRKFRALKLWFVMRSFGVEGLQAHVRKSTDLARLFESLVNQDERFELMAQRLLGLVVFRLKGDNEITEKLLKQLNKDGLIHVVPARVKTQYIIRFTVTSYHTTESDIQRDWRIIQTTATRIMREVAFGTATDEFLLTASTSPSSASTRLHDSSSSSSSAIDQQQQHETKRFQSSLLLSNVPQTPKVVNASFLAFFPDMELTLDIVKELTKRDYALSHLPLKPRRKFRANKSSRLGMSLDHAQRARWSSLSSSLPPSSDMESNCEELTLNELTISNGGENGVNGRKYNHKAWSKQASLDSKIEHILDEADEVNNSITNGETTDRLREVIENK